MGGGEKKWLNPMAGGRVHICFKKGPVLEEGRDGGQQPERNGIKAIINVSNTKTKKNEKIENISTYFLKKILLFYRNQVTALLMCKNVAFSQSRLKLIHWSRKL